MNCPHCAAPAQESAEECSACGVNFSKWKAKAEKEAAEKAAAPEPEPVPAAKPASGVGKTLLVMSCLCAAVYGTYEAYRRRVEPPPERVGVIIKPDIHRTHIAAIETALYKDAPAAVEDGEAISQHSSQLAGALMERHPNNPFVRDAVGDLMELSGATAAAQDKELGPDARLEWTRRWEALRARRFEKAPWLHPAVTAPGPAPDFEKAAQGILTAANSLKTLLAAAAPELDGFGDGAVDPAALKRGGDAKERLELWRAWLPQWRDRVDSGLAGILRPDAVPDELQAPYGTLLRSVQEARNPPSPAQGAVYLPGKAQRDAWTASIDGWLSGLPDAVNGARAAKDSPKPAQQ